MKIYLLKSFFIISITLTACNNNSEPKISESTEKLSGWELVPFTKVDSVNPVIKPDTTSVFTSPILKKRIRWEEKDVFNPGAIVRNDTVFLLYRAEDAIGKHSGTSRIGLAWSTDGLHFTRHPEPVLYPDNDAYKEMEWEGGCEDPRVVQDATDIYYLTYTAYNGYNARLLVASSNDLYHWTKHGHAFAKAFDGKYVDKWTKAGSIVSKYENGKTIATKINGKYWMYWGDVNICSATSDDLINWAPVLYNEGERPEIELRHNAVEIADVKIVFGPRKGKFDSDIVEAGPPALLTEKGIVLIYNSRNVPSIGDTSLAEGTYAAGQVLMDKNNPTKVIDRMDNYFLKPEKPYEIMGQVNHVCFVQGLVNYRNKWFLYYGTADSKIAVAVK